MYWAISHVIKNYLREREIVILGSGLNSLKWSAEIIQHAPISLSISTIEEVCHRIDNTKHYIIICEDKYTDYSVILQDMGFTEIKDYYNWTKYDKTNGHLPIDINFNGIFIGYGSYFSFPKDNFKHITSIGRFCSISNTAVIQGNHSMNRITTSSLYPILNKKAERIKDASISDKDPRCTDRKLSIGNDVWIGANVFINSSKVAKIGDGAIIGTNSLVLSDVPPYAIIFGSPARIKRYRFSPEQIEILLNAKWWNWNEEEINNNIELLMNPELFFSKLKTPT